jgi:hypothetical protein
MGLSKNDNSTPKIGIKVNSSAKVYISHFPEHYVGLVRRLMTALMSNVRCFAGTLVYESQNFLTLRRKVNA